ncbi:MAG: ADP-ribosylglycohydrolase family protein [Candidatus Lokiarchaeota archaeon]|nr:ADP-ribosylglycohydrolase family protein [Candidatus Harpocratesius repetitus]
MLGAIFGDIVGSIYEFKEIPKGKFLLLNPKAYFTDDTVLTIAIAEFLLTSENLSIENLSTENLTNILQRYGRKYRNCGFGANFRKWMMSSTPQPYNSWGNGSAMRVSPVGFFYSTEEEVLQVAEQTAKITHNHPEGIKGAQATALAVFLARNNKYSKKEILEYLEHRFKYDLHTSLQLQKNKPKINSKQEEKISLAKNFDVSCQKTVPLAIRAFFESQSFPDTIRKAVSIGGDTDTIACIAGAIAESFYGIPKPIINYTRNKLPLEFIAVIDKFQRKIQIKNRKNIK